jgi:hypothetical protein
MKGLLYSQIGYDAARPVRLVFRGPADALAPDAQLVLGDGTALPLRPHGALWGSHWWVAEAPRTPGAYQGCLNTPERVYHAAWTVAPDLLHCATWESVGPAQAEIRQRFSQKHQGAPLGWFDAGMHWQEANAHAAYLHGLADLLALRGPELPADATRRLVTQLRNGADYLALLQDLAAALPDAEGALVHQSFKLERLLLPSDAAKAAAGWAHVADVLPASEVEATAAYRTRARRALDWFLLRPRQQGLPFCALPHGAAPDTRPPDEFSTPDLACCVDAARRLRDPRLFALIETWLARQISPDHAEGGLHGHFRLFDSVPWNERAWTHGFDPEGHGFNLGMTHGHHLRPLLDTLRAHPDHPAAPRWRTALERYAYGYFLPACRANPFLIMPLGWYPGEGLIWFGGMWHGGNAIYAHAAALALEFERWFGDAAFGEIATGNLQWIAGLHAGLHPAALRPSCHLWSDELPEDEAVPASMIQGIGQRSAGSWLHLRGAICNGFATGDQFVWDVPPVAALDGPHAFTDEDWITHAGAWLSATARLAPSGQK